MFPEETCSESSGSVWVAPRGTVARYPVALLTLVGGLVAGLLGMLFSRTLIPAEDGFAS
jgi:hypothetical protein